MNNEDLRLFQEIEALQPLNASRMVKEGTRAPKPLTVNEIVKLALNTDEGRTALSVAMVAPMRKRDKFDKQLKF